MTWKPKYTISNKLLPNIRGIGESMGEIKTRKASIRDTEREVLNYNMALQSLYKAVRVGSFRLNVDMLERIQGQVVDGLMDNSAHCGALREAPVVIRNPRKVDEIVFIPPDAKVVRPLMSELMKFINNNIGLIDPIILAGIFHRQCVIIHPFIDGNGRTTRLLTTAIMGAAGLDLFEIFSFENYYNRNITRYFKAVGFEGDYYDLEDKIDFSEWSEYFSDGVLDELRRMRKILPTLERSMLSLKPHHQHVLDYIEERGTITQREYGRVSSRSLVSRKIDFDKLTQLKLIETQGVGRGTYYTLSSNYYSKKYLDKQWSMEPFLKTIALKSRDRHLLTDVDAQNLSRF